MIPLLFLIRELKTTEVNPEILTRNNCIVIEADYKDGRRWVNVVTSDPYPPPRIDGKQYQTPYYDPPPGGYTYQYADKDIYYWETKDSIPKWTYTTHIKGSRFIFKDCPRDSRLKNEETVDFKTCLVDSFRNDKLYCLQWRLKSNRRVEIYGDEI